ncbi:MAG TPA: hypothetical protein VLL54_03445 [Pyrinomonadaceae bacterium]|nr:hypothetical protein [Pyrinomonadaceae bacterium]
MKYFCAVVLAFSLLTASAPQSVAQTRSGKSASRRITQPQTPGRASANSPAVPSQATRKITVKKNGTFEPNQITINPGETVKWEQMERTDAIVQIKDPSSSGYDVCGIANANLAHAFDGNAVNEFTGPTRIGVSGIFALGPNGPGFKKLDRRADPVWKCQCELARNPNCNPQPTSFGDYKICEDEGAPYEFLPETWDNPDITGVILRMNWNDIQQDINGQIQYVWTDLDRNMNLAIQHGKLFTIDIRAGRGGTPSWIFSNYSGAAGPGPVMPLDFKDWAGGDTPENNNCGYRMTLGSPTHTTYLNVWLAMVRAVAKHVASDSRWFEALAAMKASGANFVTSEARLPHRCYSHSVATKVPESKGIAPVGQSFEERLNVIDGDRCFCNPQIWANASYTPEALYKYYRAVENAIYQSFYWRKSIGYQLIQDGFPKVAGPTNFEGDSIKDWIGNPLLLPQGNVEDDIDSVSQTVEILAEGRSGRFVDPYGRISDSQAGLMFVPQHSGIQQLPDDANPSAPCPGAQKVDGPIGSTPARARFPKVSGKTGAVGSGCPNQWAVNEGLAYQVTGFQTTNDHTGIGSVGNPAQVESALWNLTINSNAVFLELYEDRLWEIFVSHGSGETARPLSVEGFSPLNVVNSRSHLPTAPFSKTLLDWVKELHDRRRELSKLVAPRKLMDPFPNVYEYTFSNPTNVEQTYYYINPTTCANTNLAERVGKIVVRPGKVIIPRK